MRIIADTHLHVYPFYDHKIAFENLLKNLSALGSDALKAAFLLERYDCSFFADLKEGKVEVPGFEVETCREDGALIVKSESGLLYLFAGRQLVTRERVEIGAFFVEELITDGMSASETVEKVLSSGGLPVVCWAPGKWFFDRGKVVRELIQSHSPDKLLLGDTSLRPPVWPEPSIMKMANKKGCSVVAGSDPLPFAGEEHSFGQYCSIVEGEFNKEAPLSSMKAILKTPGSVLSSTGRRSSSFEVLTRLKKNAKAKS